MRGWICLAALALASSPLAARPPSPPTPLFASDAPIHITITGPISNLVSNRREVPRPGTLTVPGEGAYPITLTPRGITRLASDVCQFPPLRVEFTRPPPAGSLFQGQRKLKLVAHCKRDPDFQQKVLLEYAAYRMYNLMTPQSFRVRLANIDYVDNGKPYVSRLGFFIEDFGDVAKRNGMSVAHMGPLVALQQIEPRSAARQAVFEYMISNYDWSERAGPQGTECCHNSRLMTAGPGSLLTTVPYDFDFSGLVDAPYAGPPEGIPIRTLRDRNYRGYCAHMNEARAAAAEFSAKRGELLGVLATIPGMSDRTRASAASYLGGFFQDLDSGKIFRSCVN
ncbi:MAG TPA: hypothetical protein VF757_06125 [Sphingomicrobium sp.]